MSESFHQPASACLLLFCALFMGCALISSSQVQASVDDELQKLLGWLPRDTKMVFVTTGPFRFAQTDLGKATFLGICKIWNLPGLNPPNGKTNGQEATLLNSAYMRRGGDAFQRQQPN